MLTKRASPQSLPDASAFVGRVPSLLACAIVCAAIVGCNPPPEPVVCDGRGEFLGLPGKTGLTFEKYASGDTLATWERPQGGIGTRLNVRLQGVEPSRRIDLFQTLIRFPVEGDPGGPGEDGGICADDADGNPTICNDEALSCLLGTCRRVIADQTNRQFPAICDDDGYLLVTEVPIRFRTRVSLADIDGREAELSIRLDEDDRDGEFTVSEPVLIRFDVGEFIQPSWWDEG